jgi:hypothetical protein
VSFLPLQLKILHKQFFDRISMAVPTDVQEIVSNSGNSFHAKVAQWFVADGWHTTVSPYYVDHSHNKSREVDLIVEKSLTEIRNSFGQYKGQVIVRLFVECKFIPAPSVFWFVPKNGAGAFDLISSMAPFRENNTYTAQHHYIKATEAAKVFSSKSGKDIENEPFYKALNQALHSWMTLKAKSPSLDVHGDTVTLDFPVIVCSSFEKLWREEFYSVSNLRPIEENFLLEVQYAYSAPSGAVDQHCLVDVVAFEALSMLVQDVKRDAEIAAFFADE